MFDLPPVDPVIVQEQCAVDYKSTIQAYKKARKGPASTSKASESTREDALRKEALVVGALAGKKSRNAEINELLGDTRVKIIMDSFDFAPLMYGEGIVPPVISEAQRSISITEEGTRAKTTTKSWRIVKPAYISTERLNWHTYLVPSTETKTRRYVYGFFAPISKSETDIWKSTFCTSFAKGVDAANATFVRKLQRFKRDYLGMIRFKMLERSGVVSAPTVVESRVGTVVGDNWVQIDQRDIRITDPAEFNKSDGWQYKFAK